MLQANSSLGDAKRIIIFLKYGESWIEWWLARMGSIVVNYNYYYESKNPLNQLSNINIHCTITYALCSYCELWIECLTDWTIETDNNHEWHHTWIVTQTLKPTILFGSSSLKSTKVIKFRLLSIENGQSVPKIISPIKRPNCISPCAKYSNDDK